MAEVITSRPAADPPSDPAPTPIDPEMPSAARASSAQRRAARSRVMGWAAQPATRATPASRHDDGRGTHQ
jgi:hypothetical protein